MTIFRIFSSMRTLYYSPICPFSRKIRFLLAEKKIDFTLIDEPFWTKNPHFIKLNPLGQVPIFIDLQDCVVVDSSVISEYLEETYCEKSFLGATIAEKTEVRRVCAWFDHKFFHDVTLPLLKEKFFKRFFPGQQDSGPNSQIIRAAKNSIIDHLRYLEWLIERRPYLGGAFFSLADMAAGSHISVVDYFGDIAWEKFLVTREWFFRIKSRPTFRAFLKDRIPGIAPCKHYENLDF
jgi:glutathione S-transferase